MILTFTAFKSVGVALSSTEEATLFNLAPQTYGGHKPRPKPILPPMDRGTVEDFLLFTPALRAEAF
jgi:hypothetical protein